MNTSREDRLPPNQQLVRADRWPVVGETAAKASSEPWFVAVGGLVKNPLRYSLAELHALPQEETTVDIHCVTRWSKYDVTFGGVMLETLLQNAVVRNEANFVSFQARSERGHSTSLDRQYLQSVAAMIALRVDGQPLPPQHGGPIRMIVPGKYFYKSVKWLNSIELLSENRLGYWEAEAGYHDTADPWREQRYIASSVSKQDAAKLIAERNFDGLDLMGISAANRDLTGLSANGAWLRNADFRKADLPQANFANANLSNASFEGANLQGAVFQNADLEGANFAAADLRGANLLGASLFGATFTNATGGQAKIDAATRIKLTALNALTDEQSQFMRSQIGRSGEVREP